MPPLDQGIGYVGCALHWTILGPNWTDQNLNEGQAKEDFTAEIAKPESNFQRSTRLIVAYLAGMVGHIFSVACKILLLVGLIFFSLGMAFSYLICSLQEKRCNENKILSKEYSEKVESRLLATLVLTGVTVPAILVDVVGILCPPLAYKGQDLLRDNITNPVLEKCQILEKEKLA